VSVRRLAEQIGILVNVADDFNPLEWFKIKNPDSHGDAATGHFNATKKPGTKAGLIGNIFS
jgi:hypothetical protein